MPERKRNVERAAALLEPGSWSTVGMPLYDWGCAVDVQGANRAVE
jgi:hypothetical protein